MPAINPQRLIEDLSELRQFGAKDSGVVRTTYSDVDIASRHWLVEKMRSANLDASIDGVGNVIGRSRLPGKCVLLGSHTDTQLTGGWLDGALGVIYGLEVARAMSEDLNTQALAVDVASWADEESSYLGMVGSRSFCGQVSENEIKAAVGKDGRRLIDALEVHGLLDQPRTRLDPSRQVAYLEAHIEQGPTLEAANKKIGVVTTIIGMRDFEIAFSGQQNHAGTTPMKLRRDAGMQLIHFAHGLTTAVAEVAGDRTVWTIGNIDFEPGAPSIIPGRARMLWQFRDPEETRLDQLQRLTEDMVESFNATNAVQATLILRDNSARAAPMNDFLQQRLASSAQIHCAKQWVSMPSGAAHDAQNLANHIPTGMLFIPSVNGISHSFEEDSHEEDIILGCQVLADAVAEILIAKNS